MQQTCPGPYQAGPSHRLECKHSAVPLEGGSGWARQAISILFNKQKWIKIPFTLFLSFLKLDLWKPDQLLLWAFFDLKFDVLFIIPGEKQQGKSDLPVEAMTDSPVIRTH